MTQKRNDPARKGEAGNAVVGAQHPEDTRSSGLSQDKQFILVWRDTFRGAERIVTFFAVEVRTEFARIGRYPRFECNTIDEARARAKQLRQATGLPIVASQWLEEVAQ